MAVIHTIRFLAGWLLLSAATAAWAGPPEISYVHPDYPTAGPRVITGEGLLPADGSQLEVLCWRPPESKEEVEAGLQAWAQGKPPPWPAEPPKDATRVPVVDSEPQVAVAALSGVVVWVRTSEGVSRPYAFDLAMPWWLLEDEAQPGDIVALGGRALRAIYRQDAVALLADGKATRLTPIQPRRDYRTMDENVMFLPAAARPSPRSLPGPRSQRQRRAVRLARRRLAHRRGARKRSRRGGSTCASSARKATTRNPTRKPSPRRSKRRERNGASCSSRPAAGAPSKRSSCPKASRCAVRAASCRSSKA